MLSTSSIRALWCFILKLAVWEFAVTRQNTIWVCRWGWCRKRLAPGLVIHLFILTTEQVGLVQSLEAFSRPTRWRKRHFAFCLSWGIHLLMPLENGILVLRSLDSEQDILVPRPLDSIWGSCWPLWFPGFQSGTELHHWVSWWFQWQLLVLLASTIM